jgi:hypothetical protein
VCFITDIKIYAYRAGGCSSMVEYLLSKCKVLDSIPSMAKRKKSIPGNELLNK